MIEQVICANAHTFIGTARSTFTGYITRMRGEASSTTTAAIFHSVGKREMISPAARVHFHCYS
jgi:hypothetical protein